MSKILDFIFEKYQDTLREKDKNDLFDFLDKHKICKDFMFNLSLYTKEDIERITCYKPYGYDLKFPMENKINLIKINVNKHIKYFYINLSKEEDIKQLCINNNIRFIEDKYSLLWCKEWLLNNNEYVRETWNNSIQEYAKKLVSINKTIDNILKNDLKGFKKFHYNDYNLLLSIQMLLPRVFRENSVIEEENKEYILKMVNTY